MSVLGLDHVQIAIPPGGEDRVRAFYVGVLGLAEIPKPADLAARGGLWLALGGLQLHLGVEADFRPARKAHPALRVRGLADYLTRARASAAEVVHEPERRRAFLFDPFGNRIELIETE